MDEVLKEYECIKELALPKCDDDGFTIENEYGYVTVGSKWQRDNSFSVIGGEVHLESLIDDEFGWIEITEDDLFNYFKALN